MEITRSKTECVASDFCQWLSEETHEASKWHLKVRNMLKSTLTDHLKGDATTVQKLYIGQSTLSPSETLTSI